MWGIIRRGIESKTVMPSALCGHGSSTSQCVVLSLHLKRDTVNREMFKLGEKGCNYFQERNYWIWKRDSMGSLESKTEVYNTTNGWRGWAHGQLLTVFKTSTKGHYMELVRARFGGKKKKGFFTQWCAFKGRILLNLEEINRSGNQEMELEKMLITRKDLERSRISKEKFKMREESRDKIWAGQELLALTRRLIYMWKTQGFKVKKIRERGSRVTWGRMSRYGNCKRLEIRRKDSLFFRSFLHVWHREILWAHKKSHLPVLASWEAQQLFIKRALELF